MRLNRIYAFLIIVVLSLPILYPLLRGLLPLTADGTLHLYRLVTLDHALSDGTLWARYAASMAYGYGAPFFNYYSPLSLYPLLILHKLGFSYLDAWIWGMVGYTLLAGFGAYLLGRVCTKHEMGGLITAAAYLYAPYSLYDVLWRGTVSEYAALAILPYVLWAITRLASTHLRRDWVLVAVTFAIFIPMHNVITLHGAVLIGFYTLFVWRGQKLQNLLLLISPLVIGLLMTAFFWLPAITETQYVKLDAITATLPFIDVVNNLTPLSNIFALPVTADPTQLQQPISIVLSWWQIVLGIIGLVLVYRGKSNLRGLTLFCVIVIAVLIFLNTPASAVIWRTLPLIRYSQYPWRLLGLASLLLALLAGIGTVQIIQSIKSQRLQPAAVVVILAGIMLYGFPYLYPIYLSDVNPQNINDALRYEQESGLVATSSFGEYLPIWNYEPPDTAKLLPRFVANPIISRLDASVLIARETWWNTSAHLEFTADSEVNLVFDWFYFPGWQATLNGEPLNLAPTTPHGLIQATVPAGTHTLNIWLGSTERQNLAWIISGAGLVILAAGIWVVRAKSVQSDTESSSDLVRWVLIAGLGLFALKFMVIDSVNSPIKRERFAQVIEHPYRANFGNTITLIDWDIPSAEVKSGDTLNLSLYWRLFGSEIPTDYSSVLTLRDENRIEIAQVTNWQPGGLETHHWLSGYYVQEQSAFPIPTGTVPGNYTLEVSLYDPLTGQHLNVINADGNPTGVTSVLGSITIAPPDVPFTPDEIAVDQPINHNFASGTTLVGINKLPENVGVGQSLTIASVWLSHVPTMRIVWLQGDQPKAKTEPLTLASGQWRPEDTYRWWTQVYIPGDLESGLYDVGIAVDDETVVVGRMTITAPERVFETPEMAYTADVQWVNGMRLLGYAVDTDNHLTLFWQTNQPLTQYLNYFVHVVNDEGIIVEQVAGVPVGYTRPTTGWAVGEVTTDIVPIKYPPDKGLKILIGWFDPVTQERVVLEGGGDFWNLPTTR